MTDAAALAADPAWLPHHIDLAARRVMFLHLDRRQLSEPGFLADREPFARRSLLPLDAFVTSAGQLRPLHFVFHTGFCRSTLLIRSLDAPGVSVGLNEPGILNSLVRAGPAAAELLAPTLAWLSRRHADGETIVVKPSNYANPLIEPILRASPSTKAVLMTNRLPDFLTRVARKGLMGRLWGRQVFLEMHSIPGSDLGLDMRAIAAMSDLQAAGLGWFLKQQMFDDLLRGELGSRLAVLHGERFNQAPAETILAAASLFGLAIGAERARTIAGGAVFRTHAKGGGDFAEAEAEAVRRGASPAIDEEIAQVDQWIGKLARQSGQRMPVPQTLL